MSSLCFQDAVVKRKANEITEDAFLEAIVNHCTGISHGANKLCNNDTFAPNKDRGESFAWGHNIDDPFTSCIAKWIYFNFGDPVEGNVYNFLLLN
jgi:hypothetical protein